MKKMLTALGLAATILAGSGCATVQHRVAHVTPAGQDIYPAVRLDVNMCRYVWSERHSDALMATVVFTGYAIDVPVSCITDTICLPYDLWRCRRTKQQKESEENGRTEPQGER